MCPTSRPRVLIADDHVLVAEALRTLVSPEFEVVAIVHDGRTLIDTVRSTMPDVVLVDISMPVLNGLHAGERLKRDHPKIKVIYVTVTNDAEIISESLARGADGYVLKTAAPSELVTAIRSALRGERYISPAFAVRQSRHHLTPFSTPESAPGPRELTDRQLDILQLLAEGRSMKEVASMLNLTTRTVAFHKYRVMRRLNLHNDSQVVQYAVQHHIIAAR
jgi:DNA-binding NarL/FixJ family response regulator